MCSGPKPICWPAITFEQAARTNYSYLRRVFNADLARPLSARTTISGRYTWEFTRVFDNILPPEDQSLIDRLFPQVRLSILSGTLFWNGRTTQGHGHQLSTSIDFALPGLGSEVGFVKNFSLGVHGAPVGWIRKVRAGTPGTARTGAGFRA